MKDVVDLCDSEDEDSKNYLPLPKARPDSAYSTSTNIRYEYVTPKKGERKRSLSSTKAPPKKRSLTPIFIDLSKNDAISTVQALSLGKFGSAVGGRKPTTRVASMLTKAGTHRRKKTMRSRSESSIEIDSSDDEAFFRTGRKQPLKASKRKSPTDSSSVLDGAAKKPPALNTSRISLDPVNGRLVPSVMIDLKQEENSSDIDGNAEARASNCKSVARKRSASSSEQVYCPAGQPTKEVPTQPTHSERKPEVSKQAPTKYHEPSPRSTTEKKANLDLWFGPRCACKRDTGAKNDSHAASPSLKSDGSAGTASLVARLPKEHDHDYASGAMNEVEGAESRAVVKNEPPIKKAAFSHGTQKSEDTTSPQNGVPAEVPCNDEVDIIVQVSQGGENTSEHLTTTASDELDPEIKAQLEILFANHGMKEKRPCTYEEFLDLWEKVQDEFDEAMEDIEKGQLVRGANGHVEKVDSSDQAGAMYGRLLPRGTQKLVGPELMNLNETSRFVDIGSGIGNAPLQVAYTVGCTAFGIELDSDRHWISTEIEAALRRQNNSKFRGVGHVEFVKGKLEDPSNRQLIVSCDAAFVNNAENVFGHKSQKARQKYTLDHYLAGIFSLMKPGSVMVTLTRLDLGPSLAELNKKRKEHGLLESPTASYFERKETDLGPESISWGSGGRAQECFMYTRVDQGTEAFVLCHNLKCDSARTRKPIPVSTKVQEGGEERIVVVTTCPDCRLPWRNNWSASRKKPERFVPGA